jgi:hypothetical protein
MKKRAASAFAREAIGGYQGRANDDVIPDHAFIAGRAGASANEANTLRKTM